MFGYGDNAQQHAESDPYEVSDNAQQQAESATYKVGDNAKQQRRPRRPAAARRAQLLRSNARMVSRMIAGLSSVQEHRGSSLGKVGEAMLLAGLQVRDDAATHRNRMPICRHFARGTCTYGSHCRFAHISSETATTTVPLVAHHAPKMEFSAELVELKNSQGQLEASLAELAWVQHVTLAQAEASHTGLLDLRQDIQREIADLRMSSQTHQQHAHREFLGEGGDIDSEEDLLDSSFQEAAFNKELNESISAYSDGYSDTAWCDPDVSRKWGHPGFTPAHSRPASDALSEASEATGDGAEFATWLPNIGRATTERDIAQQHTEFNITTVDVPAHLSAGRVGSHLEAASSSASVTGIGELADPETIGWKSGDRIMIAGLTHKAELNGEVGTLVRKFTEGRWEIRLDNETRGRHVKTCNIVNLANRDDGAFWARDIETS